MATAFKRGNKWCVNVKLWDAAKGKTVWVQKSTGLETEAAALVVGASLENASEAAKAGTFTKAKALELVNDMLRMAGLSSIAPAPMTFAFAAEMANAPDLAFKTGQKYRGCLDRFKAWAGSDRALDAWTLAEWQKYYDGLLLELTATTANCHLRFWRGVFIRAQKLGLVTFSPAAGVISRSRIQVPKMNFTRADVVKLLRRMRNDGRKDWALLALLGWHTGHRIQDLLDLTAANLEVVSHFDFQISFQPGKRENSGGRKVTLPVPRFVGLQLQRQGNFKSLGQKADNWNGNLSAEFIVWMRKAGVDPMPVGKAPAVGATAKSKMRLRHLKSFHSFRHSMTSRLAAAGVEERVAMLVTDHTSPRVHAGYLHAEVTSLRAALKLARRM